VHVREYDLAAARSRGRFVGRRELKICGYCTPALSQYTQRSAFAGSRPVTVCLPAWIGITPRMPTGEPITFSIHVA